MNNFVSQSQFFMWRTLFSVAHADNVVTDDEVRFMARILDGVNFTDAQTSILKDDIKKPKNVIEMFKNITNQNDRLQFFNFARDLVWADGEYCSDEQNIMVELMKEHMKEIDVGDLVGNISMELEESQVISRPDSPKNNIGIIKMLTSFRKVFS